MMKYPKLIFRITQTKATSMELYLFILMFTWSQMDAGPVEYRGGICIDYKNRAVPHLSSFVPDILEPCTSCTCIHGVEERCIKSQSCPLPCSHYFTVVDNNDCCQFLCSNTGNPFVPPFNISNELLPTITNTEDFGSLHTNNVGLRLVASTITSFLVLALLLFMIHRLRQRRLLLMIRRLNGGQMSNGGYGARRFSYEDDNLTGQNQVDLNIFEDPPPPYTFWKPPDSYFPQEEAPPPYNEAQPLPPQQIPQPQQPRNSLLLTSFNPFISSISEPNGGVTLPLNDLDAESADRRPRHSVPVQDLNVMESFSSLNSSRSDLNESHSLNVTVTDNIIRSDETYEDFHQHQPNSASNLMAGVDLRPSKCHSCSDVVVSNWQASGTEKRRSLQQEWNMDGSETSSSSSPSYTRTLSPTSSDSSSIYNFETEMSNLGKFGSSANCANGSNSTSSANCAASVKLSCGANLTNCASVGKLSNPGNSNCAKSSENHLWNLPLCTVHIQKPANCATLPKNYSTNSNPTNFSSSAKNLSCGQCSAGTNVAKCQSSADFSSPVCNCVSANGSKRRPSKLRQIFGTFNNSSKAKNRFANVNRHSLAVSSGVDQQVGVGERSNSIGTRRILYVSDGDITPNNQRRRLGSSSNSAAAYKVIKSRPHSYDFGNLVGEAAAGAVGGETGAEVENIGTENRVNSFDSLTYTYSSRASFDSEMLLQNSSTFHSQEGLAFSPEYETETLRCSSTVAEPPSSPETTSASTQNFPKWSLNKRNCKSSLKKYTEEDETEEEPSENARIRLTLDTSKESSESYI
ncbi:Integral membrane protein dgcr2/IDD [Chamberlinius hualienensis]